MSDIKKIKLNGVIYNITAEPDTTNLVTKSGLAQSTGSATNNAMSQKAITDALATKSEFSGSYNDLTDKPTIPDEVTETTVANWGFTKNTGTYSKPSAGIPSTDMTSEVQTSLGKADTAIQDISGKQDVLVSGTNIKTINNESILGSGNITISGGGTATDVQINGTSIVSNNTANILTNTAYNSSTNKIATMSDVPNVSNYYTRTESEENFGNKIYTINNDTGIIYNNDDAYIELIRQINRYLNDKSFTLKVKWFSSTGRPYAFTYDIWATERDTTNNVAVIKLYAKIIPSGYDITFSSYSSYGVNYSSVLFEEKLEAYVSLSEFDNKNITDIYNSTSLVNKRLKNVNKYSYYVFRDSNLGVLGLNNTTAYTPSGDYNPATKKYVDDTVGDINTILESIINGGGGE